MIPFFVGYALVVWFYAARYRRSWAGALAVVLGVGGLVLLNYGHWRLGQWAKAGNQESGGIMLPVLQSLMYPYTAIVGALGFYIVALPKRYSKGCPSCGYDTQGLRINRCPECGEMFEPSYRPSGSERSSLRQSDGPRAIPTPPVVVTAEWGKAEPEPPRVIPSNAAGPVDKAASFNGMPSAKDQTADDADREDGRGKPEQQCPAEHALL